MTEDERGAENAPTGAVVARTPIPMTVTPLPPPVATTLARRAAELVRVGMRHPAVVLSAGAALTVAAEIGLRLLEHPQNGSALARRARGASDVSRRTLVVNETWTVSRRIEITTPK